jgi:hypothetical protein
MRQIVLNLNAADNRLFYKELIRKGENLASELVINLSEEFQGYKYVLKFQNNSNTEVVTSEILPVEDQIIYPITNALTAAAGMLKVELNAYDLDSGLLMKTATTTLKVLEAIGDTDEVVPEAYAPWYIEVMAAAEQVNQRLDALSITTWQSLLNL